MASELSPQDPKDIWQSQNVEVPQMSLDELRSKASRFERRIWWRNAREYAGVVAVMALFAFDIYKFPSPLMRAGSALVIAGAIYVAWQLHQRAAAQETPAGGAFANCLDFHIQQLRRQSDALSTVWRWYLGLLVPGLALFVAGSFLSAASRAHAGLAAVPATALGLGIIVFCFLLLWKLNQSAARRLEGRIAELESQRRQA
jgi:Flp pilus assembly protein TadB